MGTPESAASSSVSVEEVREGGEEEKEGDGEEEKEGDGEERDVKEKDGGGDVEVAIVEGVGSEVWEAGKDDGVQVLEAEEMGGGEIGEIGGVVEAEVVEVGTEPVEQELDGEEGEEEGGGEGKEREDGGQRRPRRRKQPFR